MPRRDTAEAAEPFFGDKLYHERARQALPLLVRQAHAQQKIYYSSLADELGMPNPRNLNFVLGSIGQALIRLAEEWNEEVPAIQCLVVNQTSQLPGAGIAWFIDKDDFKDLSTKQKRTIVDAHLQKIFAYRYWNDVLEALELNPVPTNLAALVEAARRAGRGGGESEHHKKLKNTVAMHPDLVGLSSSVPKGVTEYLLPSGDLVDILFRHGSHWIAVEVKSHISGEDDMSRGLFQCVKYQAVLEAFLAATGRPQNVRVILYLDTDLPPALIPLRNVLGIEVITHRKRNG